MSLLYFVLIYSIHHLVSIIMNFSALDSKNKNIMPNLLMKMLELHSIKEEERTPFDFVTGKTTVINKNYLYLYT